jgi:hypothetical protein
MYNFYTRILQLEGAQWRFLKSAVYLTERTYLQRGCPQEIFIK